MRKLFSIIVIVICFSCDKSNRDEPHICWECIQEHIAPNEHWKVYSYFECGASEEMINHIIKSNTYSNQDSTRQEIMTCVKKE